MSKYFELDKEQGSDSTTSKSFSLYAAIAIVIISFILVIRLIYYYGGDSGPVYGQRYSSHQATYTVTGTNRTKGYDTYSLMGHCVRYMTLVKGVKEMGKITYGGYRGEDTHLFNVTDFNGQKGNDTILHLILVGGGECPSNQLYLVEEY